MSVGTFAVGTTFFQFASATYLLSAETGVFETVGPAAGLVSQRYLQAGEGDFSTSGQNADFRVVQEHALVASSGGFVTQGQDATFRVHRRLEAISGVYTFEGRDISLLKAYRLIAGHGVFEMSGQDASANIHRVLRPAAGLFNTAGQTVSLVYRQNLDGQDILIYLDSVASLQTFDSVGAPAQLESVGGLTWRAG